jgi:hypothetical protein
MHSLKLRGSSYLRWWRMNDDVRRLGIHINLDQVRPGRCVVLKKFCDIRKFLLTLYNRQYRQIINTYFKYLIRTRLLTYVLCFAFRRRNLAEPLIHSWLLNTLTRYQTLSANDLCAVGPTRLIAMRNGYQLQLRVQCATVSQAFHLTSAQNVRMSYTFFQFVSKNLTVRGQTITPQLQLDVHWLKLDSAKFRVELNKSWLQFRALQSIVATTPFRTSYRHTEHMIRCNGP